MNALPTRHALTIDAEDWAALMCMYAGRTVPVSAQFAASTHAALDLLDAHGARGTFFIVAQHADQAPAVVREIVARGHEVGSHGWAHRLVSGFTRDALREDLRRSTGTLEDLSRQRVLGHRSALFSLLPQHSWALEVMAEVGLEYDSSVAAASWQPLPLPDQPFEFALPEGRALAEFPVWSQRVGPTNLRFIGGRSARLLPHSFSVRHVREREARGLPAMLYAHSYEVGEGGLAASLPEGLGLARLPMLLSALAFQLGTRRLQALIGRLLRDFRWAPCRDILADLRASGSLPVVPLPTGP
jgi:peptidoglycan-N-acetylglucosamine deacetylase